MHQLTVILLCCRFHVACQHAGSFPVVLDVCDKDSDGCDGKNSRFRTLPGCLSGECTCVSEAAGAVHPPRTCMRLESEMDPRACLNVPFDSNAILAWADGAGCSATNYNFQYDKATGQLRLPRQEGANTWAVRPAK